MTRKHLSSLVMLLASCWVAQGCSAADPADDVETRSETLTKCQAGSSNGDYNYCDDPACPCDDGEGDCESSSQCTASPGLVCGTANGTQYGFWYSKNVCWPATCENGILDPGEASIDNGGPCGCELGDYYYDYDGDGFGQIAAPHRYCSAPTPSWVQATGDCDTINPNINPGMAEVCGDSVDNNCDGQIDEGCSIPTWCLDNDLDGYPRNTSCKTQTKKPGVNWLTIDGSTVYDCVDNNPAVNPGATEICNGLDDNCDGQTDEDTLKTWYLDNDLDGYPRSSRTQQRCTRPAYNWLEWSPSGPFDCQDANVSVNPGAAELCGDNIDSNCDGDIDAGCLNTSCTNGVQDGNETGVDCGGFCNVCSNGPTPSSCVGLANTCGSGAGQNCCTASTVFGADYLRSYDGTSAFNDTSNPATVFSTRMDWFEVSVGRFRKFVAAYDSWHGAGNPTDGAGANPYIVSSGWDSTWTIAADAATLVAGLSCDADQTWTASAAGNENRPINCVNWYEAFAFCAWDGGRLPTEAEWNLSAAGGADQRAYPWSTPPTNTSITLSNASYGCLLDGSPACSLADIARTGELSGGLSKYLQSDLGGNVWEWSLDWYEAAFPNPCVNCANLDPAVQQFKVIRGGGYQSGVQNVRSSTRSRVTREARASGLGIRCVRGG